MDMCNKRPKSEGLGFGQHALWKLMLILGNMTWPLVTMDRRLSAGLSTENNETYMLECPGTGESSGMSTVSTFYEAA